MKKLWLSAFNRPANRYNCLKILDVMHTVGMQNNHLVNSNEKMCTVCSGGASPWQWFAMASLLLFWGFVIWGVFFQEFKKLRPIRGIFQFQLALLGQSLPERRIDPTCTFSRAFVSPSFVFEHPPPFPNSIANTFACVLTFLLCFISCPRHSVETAHHRASIGRWAVPGWGIHHYYCTCVSHLFLYRMCLHPFVLDWVSLTSPSCLWFSPIRTLSKKSKSFPCNLLFRYLTAPFRLRFVWLLF